MLPTNDGTVAYFQRLNLTSKRLQNTRVEDDRCNDIFQDAYFRNLNVILLILLSSTTTYLYINGTSHRNQKHTFINLRSINGTFISNMLLKGYSVLY